MTRGDLVLVVLPGDIGKPRPALIVQSDILNAADPSSFIVCPLTTTLTGLGEFRVMIEPTPGNGLRARSEVMVDKLAAAPRRRLREVIGRLDEATLRRVDRTLALVVGIV